MVRDVKYKSKCQDADPEHGFEATLGKTVWSHDLLDYEDRIASFLSACQIILRFVDRIMAMTYRPRDPTTIRRKGASHVVGLDELLFHFMIE